jgi:hypothetical protein
VRLYLESNETARELCARPDVHYTPRGLPELPSSALRPSGPDAHRGQFVMKHRYGGNVARSLPLISLPRLPLSYQPMKPQAAVDCLPGLVV